MDINDNEIWKEHPLYVDYEGSSLGRVRRKENKRIKKQICLDGKRWLISFYYNKKRYIQYTHRFICECFYGIKNNMTVDHIDSNSLNNVLSNLRYLPFKENINNPNSKNKRKAAKTTSKAEKVRCIDLSGSEVGVFETAKKAIECLNLSDSKRASNFITDVCCGIRKSAYGYKWEYVLCDTIDGEIFKKHPTLDIEVSNFGRVKRKYNKREKITNGSENGSGYLVISIDKKKYFVHRLVAETFIPNIDNKLEVNHINGEKKDNKIENLEWVDRSENMLSKVTHSKKSHRVNLYDLNGKFIETFSSLTQMCKIMGFDLKSVRMCLNGKYKQHRGYTFKFNNF